MYATPIIYPVSQIPEKWRWVSSLNPMEMPIITIRQMFLGQAGGVSGDFTLSILFTLVVLATGVIAFNKAEKTFVDIA
jgi:lipopolysaccharide transport system permease protein